ncbi:toll/interleukin-1 receptor domain-containing protein [Mesorhizobium sp. CO1-1-7]|uniref:toll/interleukin-1 receptor domain-containing protein n=1 Tax=Mesorhizobium sp. CO1-1-7 TaxID=2876632 RepID=UPI001CD11FBA|nr:toll/interleukin-1 receptor domain-containing protein [Mesorhizobium sp. CO1-1-7]MBZ9746744.1 toll/interleukin-1 receptor domain-containing protein [Mesorhizobium sp. CO1-1-7]
MDLTYNGRPFRAQDFTDDFERTVLREVADELHRRFSSIRHPETGEFPTVVIHGDRLDDLRVSIEGSTELLAIVNERLAPEDREGIDLKEVEPHVPPKAFLSYSFDDRSIAERVARTLTANGIDVWWAEWEMKAGDSLRQKIDDGLSGCTHFLVLLTHEALKKPWVNQEMDAGLVRRISGQARFIALRNGLSASELPPLLSGMLSPVIDDANFDASIRDLVNDIYGLSRKPLLGRGPLATELPSTGYSKVATSIAKAMIEQSGTALFGDPQKSVEELSLAIGVSGEDIEDALHEIRDMVTVTQGQVLAKSCLFAAFDKHFMPWSPEDDALRIAAGLVNDPSATSDPSAVAERYGWDRRRMNAALSYLLDRKLIADYQTLANDWLCVRVVRTDETRRFLRSRS